MIVTMIVTSLLNRHVPFGEHVDAALIDNALDMAAAALQSRPLEVEEVGDRQPLATSR